MVEGIDSISFDLAAYWTCSLCRLRFSWGLWIFGEWINRELVIRASKWGGDTSWSTEMFGQLKGLERSVQGWKLLIKKFFFVQDISFEAFSCKKFSVIESLKKKIFALKTFLVHLPTLNRKNIAHQAKFEGLRRHFRNQGSYCSGTVFCNSNIPEWFSQIWGGLLYRLTLWILEAKNF